MSGLGEIEAAGRGGEIDMKITMTAVDGVFSKPLKLDVSGLKVEVSELGSDTKLVICDEGEVVSVTVKEIFFIEKTDSVRVEAVSPVEAVPQTEPEATQVIAVPLPPVSVAPDDPLFRKLSDLRKRIAAEAKLPAYTIFQDKTLKEMCQVLPLDLQAMKAIHGVGEARLAKHGSMFIDVIRAHTACQSEA